MVIAPPRAPSLSGELALILSQNQHCLSSRKCRPATPLVMWTQVPIPAPSAGTPSILTIEVDKIKLWRLAELSRSQLRKTFIPPTRKTFVEGPRERNLKRSARKRGCASVSQKSSKVLARRSSGRSRSASKTQRRARISKC